MRRRHEFRDGLSRGIAGRFEKNRKKSMFSGNRPSNVYNLPQTLRRRVRGRRNDRQHRGNVRCRAGKQECVCRFQKGIERIKINVFFRIMDWDSDFSKSKS